MKGHFLQNIWKHLLQWSLKNADNKANATPGGLTLFQGFAPSATLCILQLMTVILSMGSQCCKLCIAPHSVVRKVKGDTLTASKMVKHPTTSRELRNWLNFMVQAN